MCSPPCIGRDQNNFKQFISLREKAIIEPRDGRILAYFTVEEPQFVVSHNGNAVTVESDTFGAGRPIVRGATFSPACKGLCTTPCCQ